MSGPAHGVSWVILGVPPPASREYSGIGMHWLGVHFFPPGRFREGIPPRKNPPFPGFFLNFKIQSPLAAAPLAALPSLPHPWHALLLTGSVEWILSVRRGGLGCLLLHSPLVVIKALREHEVSVRLRRRQSVRRVQQLLHTEWGGVCRGRGLAGGGFFDGVPAQLRWHARRPL